MRENTLTPSPTEERTAIFILRLLFLTVQSNLEMLILTNKIMYGRNINHWIPKWEGRLKHF